MLNLGTGTAVAAGCKPASEKQNPLKRVEEPHSNVFNLSLGMESPGVVAN
jgi:hypothetical protein